MAQYYGKRKPKKERTSDREWRVQRELLKENPIPTIDQLIDACEQSQDIRTRALFIIIYLTAARITEVVRELKKKDIERQTKNGMDIILFKIPNRKNPNKSYKEIPVVIENNKRFIEMIKEHTDNLNDEDIIFDISQQRAGVLLLKEFGVNPHYLRHVRLTHLVTVYDFNDQDLVNYAGWTDSQPTTTYVSLRYSDYLKKLLK